MCQDCRDSLDRDTNELSLRLFGDPAVGDLANVNRAKAVISKMFDLLGAEFGYDTTLWELLHFLEEYDEGTQQ
jgi:hypothetical protein